MDNAGDSSPETGVVVISRGGAEVACRLAAAFSGGLLFHVVDKYAHLVPHQSSCRVKSFPLPLRPVIDQVFVKRRRLVLIMPVGAAVRLVGPLLQHKHDDPAVVCVDDAGKFAVSLLSGHLGGADALAREVADALGATPVITSGSHVRNTLAVDLLGSEFGWRLEADSNTVTRVSAAMVNGETVAVLQEAGERIWESGDDSAPANLRVCSSPEELLDPDLSAALIISDREDPFAAESTGTVVGPPTVIYRPRTLVVGIGCRRGVPLKHLERFLFKALENHNLSPKSIRSFATADIKKDEPGILELAQKYDAPLLCYRPDELNAVFDEKTGKACAGAAGKGGSPGWAGLNRSEAAHRLVGVWGVSEPAALLASGAGELVVGREKTQRATIAIARTPFA